jgi:hypothetical protein
MRWCASILEHLKSSWAFERVYVGVQGGSSDEICINAKSVAYRQQTCCKVNPSGKCKPTTSCWRNTMFKLLSISCWPIAYLLKISQPTYWGQDLKLMTSS